MLKCRDIIEIAADKKESLFIVGKDTIPWYFDDETLNYFCFYRNNNTTHISSTMRVCKKDIGSGAVEVSIFVPGKATKEPMRGSPKPIKGNPPRTALICYHMSVDNKIKPCSGGDAIILVTDIEHALSTGAITRSALNPNLFYCGRCGSRMLDILVCGSPIIDIVDVQF